MSDPLDDLPRLITEHGPITPITPTSYAYESLAVMREALASAALDGDTVAASDPPVAKESAVTDDDLIAALRQHAEHHEQEARTLATQIANLEADLQHHTDEAKRWTAALGLLSETPAANNGAAPLPPVTRARATTRTKARPKKKTAQHARVDALIAQHRADAAAKATPAHANGNNGTPTHTQIVLAAIAERKAPLSLDALVAHVKRATREPVSRGGLSVTIGKMVRGGQLLRAPDRSGRVVAYVAALVWLGVDPQ
jgi:hypothetical protein